MIIRYLDLRDTPYTAILKSSYSQNFLNQEHYLTTVSSARGPVGSSFFEQPSNTSNKTV